MTDLSRSPEHIRAVMARYAVLMQTADADAIATLFAEDAVLEDPVGTPAHVGRDAIRTFFKTGFDATGGGMNFVWDGPVRVADVWGAAAATVKLEKAPDPFEVETLDVMEFRPDGLVASLKAYHGPTGTRPLR